MSSFKKRSEQQKYPSKSTHQNFSQSIKYPLTNKPTTSFLELPVLSDCTDTDQLLPLESPTFDDNNIDSINSNESFAHFNRNDSDLLRVVTKFPDSVKEPTTDSIAKPDQNGRTQRSGSTSMVNSQKPLKRMCSSSLADLRTNDNIELPNLILPEDSLRVAWSEGNLLGNNPPLINTLDSGVGSDILTITDQSSFQTRFDSVRSLIPTVNTQKVAQVCTSITLTLLVYPVRLLTH